MPPGLHRQVGGLFHGREEGGKRGFQEGAGGGHGDGCSGDGDGWGCLVMYIGVFWEIVYSIYRLYTVVILPNLDITSFTSMYYYVLRWIIIHVQHSTTCLIRKAQPAISKITYRLLVDRYVCDFIHWCTA